MKKYQDKHFHPNPVCEFGHFCGSHMVKSSIRPQKNRSHFPDTVMGQNPPFLPFVSEHPLGGSETGALPQVKQNYFS